MPRDPRAYLWDVQEAALAIQSFVARLDLAGYAESEMAHSAVERKFEVIGGALNPLAKVDPALAPASRACRRSWPFAIN
jgi:uncharacterized protein with HEPN domain